VYPRGRNATAENRYDCDCTTQAKSVEVANEVVTPIKSPDYSCLSVDDYDECVGDSDCMWCDCTVCNETDSHCLFTEAEAYLSEYCTCGDALSVQNAFKELATPIRTLDTYLNESFNATNALNATMNLTNYAFNFTMNLANYAFNFTMNLTNAFNSTTDLTSHAFNSTTDLTSHAFNSTTNLFNYALNSTANLTNYALNFTKNLTDYEFNSLMNITFNSSLEVTAVA